MRAGVLSTFVGRALEEETELLFGTICRVFARPTSRLLLTTSFISSEAVLVCWQTAV